MATTVTRTRHKATGSIIKYEVYETVRGGVFTAKLLEFGMMTNPKPIWSDPADTAMDAMKAAYREFAIANFDQTKRSKPMYGYGSH